MQRRIQAMEMGCYRKILRMSYKDHVTNEEVCTKIQQAIRPHEDLLTIVKRCKLKWYPGHGLTFIRSGQNHLARHRKGGRKKRWEDNIRERTGLEFAKSQGAAENREKWRKLAVKQSVVPQRPSRLRDR